MLFFLPINFYLFAILKFVLDPWIGHYVICAQPQTSIHSWSELPCHHRLELVFTGITQRTTIPKALEKFKSENDCTERQMEKDSGEVRRMKAKAMAAPPWVIKTT